MTLKKNRLSEYSKRLLEHVKTHGPQNLAQLRPVTGELESDLVKRLRNLRTGGWLEIEEGASELRWNICTGAIPLFEQGLVAKKRQGKSKPMGEVAERRQINVMEGDYKPKPFTSPRKGSLDFSAIASRGVRC